MCIINFRRHVTALEKCYIVIGPYVRNGKTTCAEENDDDDDEKTKNNTVHRHQTLGIFVES